MTINYKLRSVIKHINFPAYGNFDFWILGGFIMVDVIQKPAG